MLFYQKLSQNLISFLFVYLVIPPIIHVKSCWEYCYFFFFFLSKSKKAISASSFMILVLVNYFWLSIKSIIFVFVGYRINLFQHVLGFECSMQSSFSSISQLLNLTKKKGGNIFIFAVYGVHNFHQTYRENPRRLSILLASIKNNMVCSFQCKTLSCKESHFYHEFLL